MIALFIGSQCSNGLNCFMLILIIPFIIHMSFDQILRFFPMQTHKIVYDTSITHNSQMELIVFSILFTLSIIRNVKQHKRKSCGQIVQNYRYALASVVLSIFAFFSLSLISCFHFHFRSVASSPFTCIFYKSRCVMWIPLKPHTPIKVVWTEHEENELKKVMANKYSCCFQHSVSLYWRWSVCTIHIICSPLKYGCLLVHCDYDFFSSFISSYIHLETHHMCTYVSVHN